MNQKETVVYTLKNSQQAGKAIEKAKEAIEGGGLVVFPTETVYGLGADATNDQAVANIFRAKNRSFENPIALHLHSVDEIEKYAASINSRARALMEKFLPGPLMLIFEKKESVSALVTGGLRKVGIRVPRHDLCLEFLKECKIPIAATSANKSGRLTNVKTEDILEDLGGKIDVLLDVGKTPLGIESTVLDVTSDPPRIIRPGFISMEEIAAVIGIAPIFSHNVVKSATKVSTDEVEARKIILEGDAGTIIKQMKEYLENNKGKKIGIIATDETAEHFLDCPMLLKMGPRNDPVIIARNIFEILKDLERNQAEVILVEGIPREGLGRTLMMKLCLMAEEVEKLGK